MGAHFRREGNVCHRKSMMKIRGFITYKHKNQSVYHQRHDLHDNHTKSLCQRSKPYDDHHEGDGKC